MTRHTEHVRRWLTAQAMPLWSEHGVDPAGLGAWEALTHDGTPIRTRNKRMRIHPRQAQVFAAAARQLATPALAEKARCLFRFGLSRADTGSGRLPTVTTPDGTAQEYPHELYDLAFFILAAAELTRIDPDRADRLDDLKPSLNALSEDRGWAENAARRLPRRQNPHMHLFEAATEAFEVTRDPYWRHVAQKCLSLFQTVFLQPDGQVLEYFTADWTPVKDGQTIEPGHIAEWVWLIHRYETVMQTETGIDLCVLFRALLKGRDQDGLLRDTLCPLAETRRLWPQTEFLRASLAMTKRGRNLPDAARPDTIAEAIFDQYLDTPVAGGWYDKRACKSRAVMSTDMPSSSLYHLYGAFSAYMGLSGR